MLCRGGGGRFWARTTNNFTSATLYLVKETLKLTNLGKQQYIDTVVWKFESIFFAINE